MRKVIICMLILCAFLCGCSVQPAAEPTQSSAESTQQQTDMVPKADLEAAQKQIADLESQVTALQQQLDSANAKVEATEAEKAAQETGAVAPEDKAVQFYDDEYVTVSYLGCDKDNRDRVEIVLLVNNKTDFTLTFQADSMALDGFDLGHPLGSDDVAPQSKGKVYFRVEEEPESMIPATFSATLKVIDFSKEMTGKQSYKVTAVNVDVSSENG